METQINKIDDNTIEVIKPVITEQTTSTFTYEYLISQRDAIQSQKDAYNAKRDAELKEVNDLLKECDKLKVTPVDEVIETIIDTPIEEVSKELTIDEKVVDNKKED